MTFDLNEASLDKTSLVPYTMPKAEMHVHISLALTIETFMRRIKKKRTNLDPDFLLERDPRYYTDLTEFHNTYEALRGVTSTPQELANVTQAYLERVAREGGIYAEISNSYRDGAEFTDQMDALSAGIEAAKNNTGIEARIVVTTLRNHGPKQAEKAAKFLSTYNNPHVTAFGLVGDEGEYHMLDFTKALHMAWHEAGLGLVPHVAEQHLHNAVDFLHAVPKESFDRKLNDSRRLRAGHGTLIYLSDSLMDAFNERSICLEVCLSANKRIGLPHTTREHANQLGETLSLGASQTPTKIDTPLRDYYNNLSRHPVLDFIRRGIPVCLGSDNPLLMNTNIGKEHSLSWKCGADTMDMQLQFTRNAIEFANIDPLTRSRLMTHITSYEKRIASGQTPVRTALGYQRAGLS